MAVTIRGLLVCSALCVLLVLGLHHISSAQEAQPAAPEIVPAPAEAEAAPGAPSYSYGPVEAGQEAYERAEAERRAAIARQGALNENMRWYSGIPGYYPYPPGLSAAYAFPSTLAWGPRRAARYAVQGPWRFSPYYPYPYLRAYRGVFEPWPVVPGDVYGYPYAGWIAQPRGQVEVPLGPGATLSRPDYGAEPPPNQGPTLAPPQQAAQPALTPPEPPPAPEPVPAPPAQPGPREF